VYDDNIIIRLSRRRRLEAPEKQGFEKFFPFAISATAAATS